MAICNGQKQKMLTQQQQQQHRLMTHSNQLRTQVVVSIPLSLTHRHEVRAPVCNCVWGRGRVGDEEGEEETLTPRAHRYFNIALHTHSPVLCFLAFIPHCFYCCMITQNEYILYIHTHALHILAAHTYVHRCKARKTN